VVRERSKELIKPFNATRDQGQQTADFTEDSQVVGWMVGASGRFTDNLFFTNKKVIFYRNFFQRLFNSMSTRWYCFMVNNLSKDI
jgi:hypothetical protein